MQSHSTEQACLHLLNLNESVSLSVVLEYDGSNSTIFDQTVEEDNFYACANFEVSHKSSEQMAFVTLLVKGDTLKIFERRSVALSSEETVTFVQTDKPIYKSGENVKLCIVTLDTKFLPINDVYPLITVQDPQNNRIFQWQNVTSSQNITELSFQLVLEPVFGDYSIVVKEKSGKTLTHQFTVDRNVLPKFEVKVSAPQTITTSDDEFQISACAEYTFGQPVHGKVQVQVCRGFFSSVACEKDKNEICEQFVAQLKNGCVSQTVNTKVFQLYRSGLFMSFYITATVTEIGTGVQISEKSSIFITPVLGSLKFSGPNNVPMANKLLQLELNDRLVGNYTTDENGEAQFSIDTSDIFDPEFRLKATYIRPQSCYLPSWLIPEYMDGHFSVQRFYSRTSSFLMIEPEPKELRCNQEKIVTIHYSLNSEAYRDDSNINFFYLVSIKFSKEQGLPGSSTGLHLQASPDSVCALRAVDKRVLLLKSEQQLSAESVYNMLPNTELYGYFYRGLNLDDSKLDPCIPQKDMFYNGLYYIPVSNHGDGDTYDIVKDMGLKVFTNLHYRKPEVCSTERSIPYPGLLYLESGGYAPMYSAPLKIASGEVTRENFDFIERVIIETIFTQLEASQDFEADISTPKDNSSEIIQASEKKTYVWTVTPKKLGTKVSRQVDMNLTNDVVEGSTGAFFTVVGDIIGLAIQNVENLFQMPYGGGEQNIALLASDTYILDYLRSTKQLTEEVKSKALFFLSNGYQKQLSFKNLDGSYSVFWQRNQEGSIRLSALTFKTFEGMKQYVFIDELVQRETLIWLASKQKIDGCFKSDGKLFSNAWEFPTLRNGLFCLEEALENGVRNGYNLAILAYAFALAGKEEKVESLLRTLDQSATKLNNVIYWGKVKKLETKASPLFIPRAPSAEMEKTCYVLLAIISQKNPDLTYASKIVQWLAQQMNSHGGFSSPQDTPVCLLAITRYMNLIFSDDQVTVSLSSEEFNEIFQVNGDNHLLVQRSELTKASGQYTVDVEGQGCAFIQATVRYNVLLPKKESGFSLSLQIVKKNSSDVFQSNFDLTVTLRYTGNHNNSNMVLVDVKMLSGFTPVMSSIEEVSGTAKSFTLSVEQINHVANIQPSQVMVYNYYEKGRRLSNPTACGILVPSPGINLASSAFEVNFRIVSVDVNFHPLNETFPMVYIENPKRNRIFQWPSFKLQGGLSQLSFPLSVEPALGPYKVVLLKESRKKIEHSFEVDEYVLPKFEVQVKMPKKISFLEDEFEVSVCSLYTYGKPVRGLVTINVCRKYLQYISPCYGKYPKSICEEFSQQTDDEGCFTQLVNAKSLQLKQKGYENTLEVEAKVREEGTGLELTGHGSSEITNTLSKLKFTKVDSHYRRGLPFFGQVLLVDEKDQPIPNETVVVNVDMFQYSARFTTNEHGLVNISIDTSNFTSSFISVGVTYKQNNYCFDSRWVEESHIPAMHTARHIFSPSKSYIQLEPVAGTVTCGQTQEIRVHYILNRQILTDETELTFYYLIKARGSIAQSGTHVLSIKQGELKGVFSFSFRVKSTIAPIAQLLVYTILPNGEVVADAETLDIENCFANKVNLSFSSTQGLPASNTSLKITATPYSLCGLRAVDKSVLLMKPEAELSPQSVYNLLPVKRTFSMGYGDHMNEDGEKCINAEDITHNGIIYAPRQLISDDDVYSIFESAGLNIFTNSKIHKPYFCQPLPYPGMSINYAYAPGAPGALGQPGPPGPPGPEVGLAGVGPGLVYPLDMREDSSAMKVKETIRKYFPETWIWELMPLELTAFVLKSFSQAQSHIFVEDSHITDSLTWLSRKQKENGCFQRSGSLLNNAIKGGVDDEVTLSAYITIALLEMPLLVTVRTATPTLYLPLVKPQEVDELYSPPRAPSVDVEMTSYSLLAHLTAQPAPSSEDLSVATQIVKWLTKQQNPSGGFSSTQDTVVALQALSKYGAATYTKGEKAATVTVKSETFSEEFQVDEAKRLLLQEVALPEIPGKYSTAVSGSGCVYVQTSLRYNILPKKERKAPFTLKVETLPKNCDGVSTHRKVQIHINISYIGERPSSNMVIVDVKMVSGFIPVKSSVRKLQEMAQIQRTEVNTNHVLIYFEELNHHTVSFSFSMEQDITVKNLKPATVKAYDYYETEEFTIEEYSVPCSAGKV
ncbi:hypothetical protein MJT46_002136 [Ovis ammon polii x Ovis aries]|nr:hypothetical protein MJT46_002136 [Ovis ammon polii x Ovis aries]